LSGQSLPGFEQVDRDTGEILAETILASAADDSMLRHYGIGRPGSRRWQTVTPVALAEWRPRGRISGASRAQADQRAAKAVAEALRHVGQNWRGVDIRVQIEPFHRKGVRADAFHPDRFGGRLHHVQVDFPEPVAGPLVIGDGRWLGLGVMAPGADRPPALHVFVIDPSEAPPNEERETLTRALRRAVMARVNEELVQARTRRGEAPQRNEPLPTFFTGHSEDGKPARSGRHEHLFFLADDSDGDGRVDRIAVLAPHLADRSLEYSSVQRRKLQRYLAVLDRALQELSVLRAGRAGLLHLHRTDKIKDNDAVFGPAESWVSCSLYRPTRHARRVAVEAAVLRDLTEECARRGLPRPRAEISNVVIGPRGGILARARLGFTVPVRGPLLLGAGSHFGAGMFVGERSF
jgi:CRISPR-associated protein Csb2